jgi:hypothetical protein
MRVIASVLLVFALTACNLPSETETNTSPEAVAGEESVSPEEVSAQACVKRLRARLYGAPWKSRSSWESGGFDSRRFHAEQPAALS